MLTADLVNGRRSGRELRLVSLDGKTRDRLVALATDLIEVTEQHVGDTRQAWGEAIAATKAEDRDTRWKAALVKLIEDRTEFELAAPLDPAALREEVFVLAARQRCEAVEADGVTAATPFEVKRAAILTEVAARHGLSSADLERCLYADLRESQELRAFQPITATALVDALARAQAQAVLLRAVRVTVDIADQAPAATRRFFGRLKFLQLLYTIEKQEGGYRLIIDGPMSLFESVTKYGLKFALLLNVLEECRSWKLCADIRWGKDRDSLTFRLAGPEAEANEAAEVEPEVSDAARALMEAFAKLGTGWSVRPSGAVLDLPGVGLCIPDLVFERPSETPSGNGGPLRVYLEILGYWSRQAVFRRVELVERGLPVSIIFAASAHLRVSEELLDEESSACLYVYKHAIRARAVADRLERLTHRGADPCVSAGVRAKFTTEDATEDGQDERRICLRPDRGRVRLEP